MKVPKHIQHIGHEFSQASHRAKATVVKWKNHMIEWIRSHNPKAAKTQAHKGIIGQELDAPGVPLSLKTKNVTVVPKLVDMKFRAQVTTEMAKQFHDRDLQEVFAADRAENKEFAAFLIDLGLLEQARANPEDVAAIKEREDAVFESFKKLVETDESDLEKEIPFSLPLVKAFATVCFADLHDPLSIEELPVLYEKAAFADPSNRREMLREMYECVEARRGVLEKEMKNNRDLADVVNNLNKLVAFPEGQRDTSEYHAAENAVFAGMKRILEVPRKEIEEEIPTGLRLMQGFGRVCFTEDRSESIVKAPAADSEEKVVQQRSPAEVNASAQKLLKENASSKVKEARQKLENKPAVDVKAISDGGKAALMVKLPVKIITSLALSVLRPRTEVLDKVEERKSVEGSIHAVRGQLAQQEMILQQAKQVSKSLSGAPKTQQQKVQELLAQRKGPASPVSESADLAEMGSVAASSPPASPASKVRSMSPVPETSQDPLEGVAYDKRIVTLRKMKDEEKVDRFLGMQIALGKVFDEAADDLSKNLKFVELVGLLKEMDQASSRSDTKRLEKSILGKMEEIYREGNLSRNLGGAREDFMHHFDVFFEVKAPVEKSSSWIGKLSSREKNLSPTEQAKLKGTDKLRRARNWFKGIKE